MDSVHLERVKAWLAATHDEWVEQVKRAQALLPPEGEPSVMAGPITPGVKKKKEPPVIDYSKVPEQVWVKDWHEHCDRMRDIQVSLRSLEIRMKLYVEAINEQNAG